MTDMPDMVKRLLQQDNVAGVILLDEMGRCIMSSIKEDMTKHIATVCQPLLEKTRLAMKELDPNNALNYLHVRAKKHEVMIMPDKNFSIIVVTNPSD